MFRLDDARELVAFGLQTEWVGVLSYWSINRDTSAFGPLYKSSQIAQQDYEFSGIFKGFESTGTSPSTTSINAPKPTPSSAPPGMLYSVSRSNKLNELHMP